jgi:hypothetical protein
VNSEDLPDSFRLYDRAYFSRGFGNGGHREYEGCRGILETDARMLDRITPPLSMLDVGPW